MWHMWRMLQHLFLYLPKIQNKQYHHNPHIFLPQKHMKHVQIGVGMHKIQAEQIWGIFDLNSNEFELDLELNRKRKKGESAPGLISVKFGPGCAGSGSSKRPRREDEWAEPNSLTAP